LLKKIDLINLLRNKLNLYFLAGLKLRLFLLVPLTLASSILEISSVSMLVPILGHFFGINDYSALGLGKVQSFLDLIFINLTLIKSVFIITILFILKNSILVGIIYFRHELNNLVIKNISEQLYKKYINLNFSSIFLLKTPYIIKILTTETNLFGRFIASVIILISEFLMLSLIIFYLFFINFKVTLIILIFLLIIGLIYYLLTKNYVSNLSKKREYMENLRLKNVQEVFSGFTTVKIFQLEDYFTKDFLNKNQLYDYIKKEGFIREIPRYFLEILLLIFITSVILIYEFDNNRIVSGQLFVLISIFSIFFIRMLPNVNKILTAISSMIFCAKSLVTISEELKITHEINNEQNTLTKKNEILVFNNNITFKNISYSFVDKKNFLNNINFNVKKNKIFGIFGPSGSGKSTLINIIVGLLKPESGEIFLDNQTVSNTTKNWRNLFSYVPQHIYIFEESIRKNILLGEKFDQVSDEEIIELLKNLQLSKLINDNDLSKKLKADGNNLSGGEKQRIGIARALITKKPILILDEATNSLDKKSQNDILKIIKSLKKEKTIIVISHDKEVIEICDNVLYLKN
jgi:ABC-type multidrug transport system fused ATPase/permease subunit